MFTHFHDLPLFSILALLLLQTRHVVAASIDYPSFGDLFSSSSPSPQFKTRDDPAHDQNPSGSFFFWLPEDEYSEDTFLDKMSPGLILSLQSFPPKIHSNFELNPLFGGIRIYVNKSFALDNSLTYVQDESVFMKGNDTTLLADGEFRNSVRISSISQYNTGHSTFSTSTVHLGDVQSGQLGEPLVEVNGLFWGIQESSRASYGEDFNLQGGSVFAMKWDENGFRISSNDTPNPYKMGFTSKPLSNLGGW
ncbi:hypothetical protein K435DRAFT_803102 [Dendrothele bispora CBS 962.96]|uniref:Uncharacterized protein n=1 Tax=Dendrothele bispora (strain CBS 962.96) TaxID=1314807 RepID=A0A4S8LJ96_DENBC|nr:hypothetical protein K435DRAFT_803102 [Dendrothele bispora CBS 962.96]